MDAIKEAKSRWSETTHVMLASTLMSVCIGFTDVRGEGGWDGGVQFPIPMGGGGIGAEGALQNKFAMVRTSR